MKFTPAAYKDKITGEDKDSNDWYNMRPGSRRVKNKIDLSNRRNYMNAVTECRSLYWTLNYFEKDIYALDYKTIDKSESPMLSRAYTGAYTFGIDIDKEHGTDIHDPAAKKAVEDMAQYFTDELRKYIPNSVYVLYSGGGIYVMIHHRVFEAYFQRFKVNDDWDMMLKVLLDSFDCLIGSLRDAFFKVHPEHFGLVKPDQLNNAQRVFKTIFSIHKKLDYAVVPLDPNNIKINFDDATLPLKDNIFEIAKQWYTEYDDGASFLNSLKPYFEEAHKRLKSMNNNYSTGMTISNSAIPIDSWAPCMQNLYCLDECGEGQTRALAVFVSFLGQIGYQEEEARDLFNELVNRWNATPSNIFESYYKNMKVPTCDRLNDNNDIGFPKGMSLRKLNICYPQERCKCVPSPLYYTDIEADKQRRDGNLNSKKPYVKVVNTRGK
jgi:hypothetical protein